MCVLNLLVKAVGNAKTAANVNESAAAAKMALTEPKVNRTHIHHTHTHNTRHTVLYCTVLHARDGRKEACSSEEDLGVLGPRHGVEDAAAAVAMEANH